MINIKLTSNKIEKYGRTLYQIEATADFKNVKKGDLGGWVEDLSSLHGDVWVYPDAFVFSTAVIQGGEVRTGEVRGVRHHHNLAMTKGSFSEDLKVGDKVVISGIHNIPRWVATVTRMTKKQIVTSADLKFWKNTLLRVGGGPFSMIGQLLEATPELLKEMRSERRRYKLKRVVMTADCNKLSSDQLERIIDVLEENNDD